MVDVSVVIIPVSNKYKCERVMTLPWCLAGHWLISYLNELIQIDHLQGNKSFN